MSNLVLASGSVFRRELLRAAGVVCETHPAPLDEGSISGATPQLVAEARAQAKAQAVAALRADGPFVVGADQVLDFHGEALGKVASAQAARELLARLSGQQHHLRSAYCLVRGQTVLAQRCVSATMAMRPLSEEEIAAYVATGEWQGTCGCYQYENRGIHLFHPLQVDQSVIVGLPLAELLADLRAHGFNPMLDQSFAAKSRPDSH